MYPAEGFPGYPRDSSSTTCWASTSARSARCLADGAHKVQIDFTEARLAMKLDPTGELLSSFIDLNNLALSRFSAPSAQRIGVHTCPGGDRDSTHSADVDYAELLPSLFELKRGQLLHRARRRARPGARAQDHPPAPAAGPAGLRGRRLPDRPARVETRRGGARPRPGGGQYIPVDQLGTTDDCGFSPFSDDTRRPSRHRLRQDPRRVEGTALASAALGLR